MNVFEAAVQTNLWPTINILLGNNLFCSYLKTNKELLILLRSVSPFDDA